MTPQKARLFSDLLPDPNDKLEELRRLADGEIVRAVAYNRDATVLSGEMIVVGSRADEFARRLRPYNRIDARFGRSYAALKLSQFIGEVQ